MLLDLSPSLHEIHTVVVLEAILVAAIIVVEIITIIVVVRVIIHTLVKLPGIVGTIVGVLIYHCPVYYLGRLA